MKKTSYRMVDEIIRAANALNALDGNKFVIVNICPIDISVQICFVGKDNKTEESVIERAVFDGHYDMNGRPGNEDEELPKLLAWVRSYYMPQRHTVQIKTPEQAGGDQAVRELREDVDRILDHLGMRA